MHPVRLNRVYRKLLSELLIENERLRSEVTYLKSPLFRLELIEDIKGTYSILLNPPLQLFRTTRNQKSCTFEVDVKKILCISSDANTKWIHFTEAQSSIEGEKLISKRLSFSGKIEDFCKKYDPAHVHLCKVSKSNAVNLNFYDLNGKSLECNISSVVEDELNRISIGPDFIEEFVQRKSALLQIISLQKILFR